MFRRFLLDLSWWPSFWPYTIQFLICPIDHFREVRWNNCGRQTATDPESSPRTLCSGELTKKKNRSKDTAGTSREALTFNKHSISSLCLLMKKIFTKENGTYTWIRWVVSLSQTIIFPFLDDISLKENIFKSVLKLYNFIRRPSLS